MSDRRRAQLDERRAVREAVFARDRWQCQIPAHMRRECMGGITPHHLRKASAGGPYTEDNLTTLCEFHNGWVEDNPCEAYLIGLVVRPLPPPGCHEKATTP